MKLPKVTLLASALSIPFLSIACNRDVDRVPNKGVAIGEAREEVLPLKDFRDKVPGIHLFDENGDERLDLNEASKYVRVMIADNTSGGLTPNDLNTVLRVASALQTFRPSPMFGIAENTPPNISATRDSFTELFNREKARRLDKQDEEIKMKKEKHDNEQGSGVSI